MATNLSRKEQKELLGLIKGGKRTKKQEARFNALIEMSDLKNRTVSSFDTPAAKLAWEGYGDDNYQFPSAIPNDNSKTLNDVMGSLPDSSLRGQTRYADDLAIPADNRRFMDGIRSNFEQDEYVNQINNEFRRGERIESLSPTGPSLEQVMDSLPASSVNGRAQYIADATPDPRIVDPNEVLAATLAAQGGGTPAPRTVAPSSFARPGVVPPQVVRPTQPILTPHQRNLNLLNPTAADFGDDGPMY